MRKHAGGRPHDLPVGDGVIDDTECCEWWLNNEGYIPIGTKGNNYMTSRAINIKSNVVLNGRKVGTYASR